jgi:RNA polymerase sigma-70 factor (ECF subfamily)
LSPGHRESRFEDLVRSTARDVETYVRNRLDSDSSLDIDDVVTDTYTIAWSKLSAIPPGFELPWLYRVAHNRILNERSKATRRRRLAALIRPSHAAPAAEDEAVADLAIRDALAMMSEPERELLLLSAWEGLGNEQLAASLRITENAAAIRLSRAKQNFLSLLEMEDAKSKLTGETDTRE